MSEEKTLFRTAGNYLQIKEVSTEPYFYARRLGVDSVAFILNDDNRPDNYAVFNERKPPMDYRFGEMAFLETAFGGSNDEIDVETYLNMDESEAITHMREIVKREVKEESGYTVSLERILFASKELVSTQMDQWVFLFFVDVTGLKQGKSEPQNEGEAMGEVRWKTLKEIKKLHDWKAKSIIFTQSKLTIQR